MKKSKNTENESMSKKLSPEPDLPIGLEDVPNHLRERITRRNKKPMKREGSCVVYWMQRSQRAIGNPAFDVAAHVANALKKPMVVFFCLDPGFAEAAPRHFDFMLRGLEKTAEQVKKHGAHFVMRLHPKDSPASFCEEVDACILLGDENPLRDPEAWRKKTAKKLKVPFFTVDSDVVVPSKLFPEEEYAARTLRPKINRLIDDFLIASHEPTLKVSPDELHKIKGLPLSSEDLLQSLPLNAGPAPVTSIPSGYAAATKQLTSFVENHLSSYPKDRNHPEKAHGTSRLSFHLHFGQIDPRTIALAVRRCKAPKEAKEAFLDELIVRRELAVNYVLRNPDYDRYQGLPEWARKTLEEHAADERPYLYDAETLEKAQTHDPLWNAAQLEMIYTGRTHGYMRMYWAKKILEWSENPEQAQKQAILLNDRYFLDGRDPNGYTNIAWAIGGKHDRPWPERAVFGKVRYMSFESTSRKFRYKDYIKRVNALGSPVPSKKQ